MRRCRPLLGTFVEVAVEDAGASIDVVDAAFDAIEEVDRVMSFHREDSDLARIRRLKAGECCSVHVRTAEVLALCLELFERSEGRFDCNVGQVLQRVGLLPGAGLGDVDDHKCAPTGAGPGYELVSGLSGTHEVRVHRPLTLDLGGIAKGHAVDRAIDVLQRAGVRRAVVNAGGDLRVVGDGAHAIMARDPLDPRLLRPLGQLSNGALATSSGCHVQAIVDPKRRRIAPLACSISVIAPRCAVADALTKVVALAGRLDDRLAVHYQATAVVLRPLPATGHA